MVRMRIDGTPFSAQFSVRFSVLLFSRALQMSTQAKIEKDFCLPGLKPGGAETFLQQIRKVVSTHSQSQIKLKKNVEEYSFRVGSLAETRYRDEPEMLEEWEQFYLPEHMFMEVIGVLEKFPCNSPGEELVLMVCEDGKVFAYEDKMLHVVAQNLKELFTSGLKFPATKQYRRGQSFEDMTDEQWEEVKESEELREMRQGHQEMLNDMKESYLENLDVIMGRRRKELGPDPREPKPVPVCP